MSQLDYAPPVFYHTDGTKIVFVEFTIANYDLRFDAATKTAAAISEISFTAKESGKVAIVLNQPLIWGRLNGTDIKLEHKETKDPNVSFNVLSKPVSPGPHRLTIKSKILKDGPYGNPLDRPGPGAIECIFNMSDLYGGAQYLGAFLPANYCYNQYKMTFSLTVDNADIRHRVFSNGDISGDHPGPWKIEFPSFFNSACPWFHLGPEAKFKEQRSTFNSVNGQELPILVYGEKGKISDRRLGEFVERTGKCLEELESNFGSFPHSSVTVFAQPGRGTGGMEYAGATKTKLASLRHELDHSYFGRNILPVNGNAAWIDEAIAEWGDFGYESSDKPPKPPANLGNRSEYVTTTHGGAYTVGRAFMEHLDHVLRQRGDPDIGLKAFLTEYAQKKKGQPVKVKEFQGLVEDFHGDTLQPLFRDCVYSDPK